MMLDNLKKYKVILASNSPRRKELLAGLGVEYEVRTLPDVTSLIPKRCGERIFLSTYPGKRQMPTVI